jgi:hypothetical protein
MGRVYNRVYDRVCFKNLILDDICIFDHLIINCEFNNCLFDNSAFVDCNFRDTTFVNCDFVELKFYGCQFKNYTIKDCSELKIPMHCPETGSFIAYKKALKVKKDFTEEAQAQITKFNELGWDKLPICMAKTQMSLSDDGKVMGRPTGFRITVRELRPSLGAGFIVALTGKVLTMPGLPKHPSALDMDVDEDGKIVGLF